MKILDGFIKEFKNIDYEEEFKDTLEGEVRHIKSKLLDECFLPSRQLEVVLNKQIRRCKYPIEIAIVGQFSSGKSTFLNALLAKDILPTGITPVTSKVTYINYADEYKLKITYKSGAQMYMSVDEISKFADQRKEQVEDIKYLTIYAPVELLKEISFVDTPGLNSQSQSDTQETLKALNDVGGIIWLSLIDNAGKMSEEEMLEKYMKRFKDKSLCILNQKDKFTSEQVESTKEYVSKKFSKYFAQVTPISAKRALEARAQQRDVLCQEEESKFLHFIITSIKNKTYSQELYTKAYSSYNQNIEIIEKNDYSTVTQKQNESNIDEVIEYINNKIKPQAKESKVFIIKKDLRGICEILTKEYEILLKVHLTLIDILQNLEGSIVDKFDEIAEIATNDLYMIYGELDSIMEEIALEIYKNIDETSEYYYKEKGGLLGKGVYIKKEYKDYSINKDTIYKNLFYDEQSLEKMIQKTMQMLKQVDLNIQQSYEDAFLTIKNRVQTWQKPYELIKKHREIASDLEFSETRHFAAKSYENILQYYHNVLFSSSDEFHQNFSYFNGVLSVSSLHAVNSSVHYFEDKIKEASLLHQENPNTFLVYYPHQDEIIQRIKEDFEFDNMESFLISKRNYIRKITLKTKDKYKEMNKDRIDFIKDKTKLLKQKIEDIDKIKESI